MMTGAALVAGSAQACAPVDAPAETVTVEVLHAGVDAAGNLRGRERLTALPAALAGAPVDVVCLQGIGDPGDRAEVRASLASLYPFSLELPTADTPPVDDPTGAHGDTPPPAMEPPCAGQAYDVSRAFACLTQPDCATGTGDALAVAACASRDRCFTDRCFEHEGKDWWKGDCGYRCRGCLADHLRTGTSFAETRARCTERIDPLCLRGEHGMMILSRLPLARPAIRVLPATGTRRAVLAATVTTDRGASVEVFCASLGPTGPSALPSDPDANEAYPGPYGDWASENERQIDRLLAFVAERRGAGPALVLGNFGASVEVRHDGEVVVPASGEVGAAHLEAALTRATAAAFTPGCTVCPDNPLVPPAMGPTWHDRIYLAGLETASVRESHRSYFGDVVDVETPAGQIAVPISMQYGFRATVALPP